MTDIVDGQSSKAKSSHKTSHSHANGPSTETHSSSPKVAMVASNYTALLNTQEQPKEVVVIIEYLHKCPLAYELLSTSPTPQSLITEVFLSSFISTRAKSKQLDVEFNFFQATLVLTKEEFAVNLGLSDIPPTPQTFFTPTSAQLLTMFKEMGSVLTKCLFGSVGGRSKEGPQPHFLCMMPYRIRTAAESGSSQPIIILDSILTKLDENSASLCSYQKYIQGITSPPKKKRKHSDHASKKSAKKKKISKSSEPPPISSPAITDDNHGAYLEEPTSLPKYGTTSKSFSFIDSLFHAPSDYDKPSSSAPVSPAHVQSVLESPKHHVSLDYDSIEDDNQDDDK
ncbi:unnamed protein product [Lactuca saligna]|uniref:Uncharacterized protein n=1 Tax=Lactuca saligna TaxID=75948 RepID=A0AA35Z4I7_LACSI|nr:unnamed protein product [Lactuca saligna]